MKNKIDEHLQHLIEELKQLQPIEAEAQIVRIVEKLSSVQYDKRNEKKQ